MKRSQALGSAALVVIASIVTLVLLAVERYDWAAAMIITIVGGAIVSAVAVTMRPRSESPPTERDAAGVTPGSKPPTPVAAPEVDYWYENWSTAVPRQEKLKRLLESSEQVEVWGVSFYRTFVGSEWFVDAMRGRIESGRSTRFALLDPDGREVTRRTTEVSGQHVEMHTRWAIAQLRLALAGATEQDHLRLFDFAPPVNYLRFDSTMYVVLFNYGSGAAAPALRLPASSWLFRVYANAFGALWEDLGT